MLALLGCGGDVPPPVDRLPLEGQNVRVLVVDDPPLAAALRGLATAWKERSGAELSVEETTGAALGQRPAAGEEQLGGDVVIYPAPLIGALADRQWLSPLTEKTLAASDLDWPDVFTALRTREATWGPRTVAVPLGSRVLACFYRADLLKKAGKQPPQAWSEYQELVESGHLAPRDGGVSQSETPTLVPTLEPLAEGWAGVTLLARAAAYARHPDYFTVAFDTGTMEPRIAGPPFVRALEELIAAVGKQHEAALKLSPADAIEELLAGRCAMALGWLPPAGFRPQASGLGKEDPKSAARSLKSASEVACVPLPGARESFDWDKRTYQPGKLRRVPLLACEGRYASASAASEHPAAAMGLLLALASGDWAVRVSSASAATSVFRGSQLPDAEQWTSAERSVAEAYAKAAAASLDTREVVYALRIPGREEYLAALDKAVRAAVSGKEKPQAALDTAAVQWRAITEKYGVAAQRTACERSDVRIEH